MWESAVRHGFSAVLALTLGTTGLGERTIDSHDRESVEKAYREWHQAQIPELEWTGDIDTCDAGETSVEFQRRTISQVNFYRAMVSLPAVKLIENVPKYQAAALMMFANNQLSHQPPETWKCYTPEGAAGARANISWAAGMGSPDIADPGYGPGAVDSYMKDDSNGNEAVGHRRWILFPGRGAMATGDVKAVRQEDGWLMATNALGVLEDFKRKVVNPPPFIAWPSAGYFPAPLLPKKRWSFSVSQADFSQAQVAMVDVSTGTPISLQLLPIRNGSGDPTVVWEVEGFQSGSEDRTIQVSVTGVRVRDETKDFQYTVQVFWP